MRSRSTHAVRILALPRLASWLYSTAFSAHAQHAAAAAAATAAPLPPTAFVTCRRGVHYGNNGDTPKRRPLSLLACAGGLSSTHSDLALLQRTQSGSSSVVVASDAMPRGIKKENLPTKVCVTCGREFTWRKKWEKVWDEVTTCSKSCNRKRREDNRRGKANSDGAGELESDRPTTGVVSDGVSQCAAAAIVDSDGVSQCVVAAISDQNDSAEPSSGVATQGVLSENVEENMEIMQGELDKDTLASLMEIDNSLEEEEDEEIDEVARRKAERKAAKKAKKAARRAQREGRGDPSVGQKLCDMCGKSIDLLIRCKYDGSGGEWKMVCGKCWKVASGGVVDGDSSHPHYQYGGLWKNRSRR